MMFWNMEGDEEERKHHQCKLSSLFVQQAGSLLWGGGGGFVLLRYTYSLATFYCRQVLKLSQRKRKNSLYIHTPIVTIYISVLAHQNNNPHICMLYCTA